MLMMCWYMCLLGPYAYEADPCATCGNNANCAGHAVHIGLQSSVHFDRLQYVAYHMPDMLSIADHR